MNMKKIILLFSLILLLIFSYSAFSKQSPTTQHMVDNPDSYIKIHDFAVYGTWSAVAILHNVVIENTSDVQYMNIRVRICYSSISSPGYIISQEEGVIPVILPPKSKERYLNAGIPFGGGAQAMNAVEIQVLGAEVAY